ncbi:hypothetical protein E2320_008175 [Naja naja]|nr:hypothetical protein E2320_008175 [Naja naja]
MVKSICSLSQEAQCSDRNKSLPTNALKLKNVPFVLECYRKHLPPHNILFTRPSWLVWLDGLPDRLPGSELVFLFQQARAEQEEEFISNTLFKKIQALQKEKETLAVNYEKEEEFLTNELSRKLMQLQHEKAELEQHLEQEQEFQVNKLMKKIKKLENDTISKQLTLEQLRREKIDLENTLEQEQEALVNRLWKRMDKLEAEKRILQEKLDQPVSAPPSPRDISMEIDSPENMMRHIRFLKNEVERLKKQLRAAQLQHSEKMAQYLEEERHMREENLRLQRKLQREMERREALCRQLSESESSLEMDDERYFNEMSAQGLRPRTVSSPIPYTPSPSSSRPISPEAFAAKKQQPGQVQAPHTPSFSEHADPAAVGTPASPSASPAGSFPALPSALVPRPAILPSELDSRPPEQFTTSQRLTTVNVELTDLH